VYIIGVWKVDGNIKFGITAPLPGESVEGLIGFTKSAEDAGFDTVWFPDHIVFMAPRVTPEAWSVVTAAAVKTGKIKMGTVGDAHRMHPAVFAHRLATVDRISNGRIFVCVGYGEKMNLDPYGIAWDKPLTRVEESIKIMRALWGGGPVNFDGEMYRLRDAELRIEPVNNKRVPIYVAATGPKALRVAGRCGDGWVTNAMPPRLFSEKARAVADAAREREDGSAGPEKTLYIFISIAGDKDEAYKPLEPVKHALIWPELLAQAGYDIEIDDEYQGLEYTKIMPNDQEMLKKFREMGDKYYTREIVFDFVAAGSKKDVIERLEAYADAGVDHFILRDFSPDRDLSMNILSGEIIPYFRK
jgi:phthiodiolone/phenolphthiodiolone dimycocerosates ketoreductase